MNRTAERSVSSSASTSRNCNRPWQISRAQGCLLGQVCGDTLGSTVDYFCDPDEIRRAFPEGVREMVGGGIFNTLAGQPTDDSEMAITLARTLVRCGEFNSSELLCAYKKWFESGPFDCGETIASSLCGKIDVESQGNGALMRCSPLGLFGAGRDSAVLADWARTDAALTHSNSVCCDVSALFVLAIATAVHEGSDPKSLYMSICKNADEIAVNSEVRECIETAAKKTWIEKSGGKQGWVLVTLQNAIWQLLHAPNLEEGIVDTINRGGATGTNAAVCGALLGSVYGKEAIPERWQNAVTSCKPAEENTEVGQPRPEEYWAADVLDLAVRLISI